MHGRTKVGSVAIMSEHEINIQVVTERFERRLAEENGKLRVEMAGGFGEMKAAMATGLGGLRGELGGLRGELGGLRAEMIERNHELLKWALVCWATQIAAVAALLALFR